MIMQKTLESSRCEMTLEQSGQFHCRIYNFFLFFVKK